MNNIAIARETLAIIKAGGYTVSDRRVELKGGTDSVEVCSPERGAAILEAELPGGEPARITVTNEDSFQAAARYDKACVMNFANAHKPGGGFLMGANAQEEALCRCSTLYSSISSEPAAEMYRYNNTHISPVESDYMLYSPKVQVFRDHRCGLLEEPFETAVVTIPAPNRRGAAVFASEAAVAEVMLRRIRIMLRIAAAHGHRAMILGAWGCGAFGNKPEKVSEYFRRVLIEEGLGGLFDEVCFAVYGREDGRNIMAFRSTFGIAE